MWLVGVLWGLETLLCITAYVVHYFTYKRMGMARYVIFRSHGIENRFDVDRMIMLLLVVISLMLIGQIIIFMRNRAKLSSLDYYQLICSVALNTFNIWILTFFNFESLRSYYFVVALMTMASFLQLLSAYTTLFRHAYFRKR